MPSYEIDVQIAPVYAELVSAEQIVHVVQAVLEREAQPANSSVTVVITDDDEIQRLNRDYLDEDRPTDVLSFAANEDSDEGNFVIPDELEPYLGDVIVSYPTALAQAAERSESVEQELALLIVHGCLHLIGYDHADDQEREAMWARQDEILRSL